MGSKLCTGATIRPNFFQFFFFSIVFESFIFVLLFSFFSSFQFLLILLFFSLLILLVGAILRLLILLLLYFKLFVAFQTCILMIYTVLHISVILWGFRGGQTFFDPFFCFILVCSLHISSYSSLL